MTLHNYRRKISDTEWGYIILNYKKALSVIQIVIEGIGDIETDKLKSAASHVNQCFPDSTLGIVNKEWVTKFNIPDVKKIRAFGWDGFNFEDERVNKSVFQKKMNPFRDSLCSIVIIDRGHSLYSVVFRIFHGIMDGQGALLYIKSIMMQLRGEQIKKTNWIKSDIEFLANINATNFPNKLSFNQKSLFRSSSLYNKKLHWKRITLPQSYLGIIPKIAKALSSHLTHSNNVIMIPTDLRRHQKKVITTGNLSLPIYLKYDKNQDWSSIYKKLFKELLLNNDLNIKNANLGIIPKFPFSICQILLSSMILYQNITSKYLCGGTISSLGKINLNEFSTSSFKVRSLFSMATHQPMVPISLAVTETINKTEITLSGYKNIISDEISQKILLSIKQSLKI